MDEFEGLEYEPATLHKYLYSANDPGNRIDPSGLDSLPAQLATLSGAVTLMLSNLGGATTACLPTRRPCARESFQGDGYLRANHGS